MTAASIAIVCAGGALGALCRFWLTLLGARLAPRTDFPLPTLFVNLTGSLLLGVLLGATGTDLTAFIDAPLLLFGGVGFCGAYTTFSSFCTEMVALFEKSKWRALVYLLATVVGCVIGFFAAFHVVI